MSAAVFILVLHLNSEGHITIGSAEWPVTWSTRKHQHAPALVCRLLALTTTPSPELCDSVASHTNLTNMQAVSASSQSLNAKIFGETGPVLVRRYDHIVVAVVYRGFF